jgi:hypothetical protein
MSGETLLKADKDFTKEVDKVLPEAQQLAKVGPSSLFTPSANSVL